MTAQPRRKPRRVVLGEGSVGVEGLWTLGFGKRDGFIPWIAVVAAVDGERVCLVAEVLPDPPKAKRGKR